MLKTVAALLTLAGSASIMAQTRATGFINYTQSGANYTYDITLTNTGTTAIGTLWYAWIPGQNYLPIAPTATSGPANWTFTRTHNAATNDGFALRWVAATGSTLAPGQSLSGFSFTTTTTPAELAGNSLFYNHPPVGTTFVYEGTPFVGGSSQFVVNPVPEPTTTFGIASGVALLWRRRAKTTKVA